MADIIQIAEKLNSEVTRLNNERSKLEGMLESAKTNYEKAVKAYEVKYGVKLTEETLQQEYNNVFARTKGAILDLQDKIESIKRGDYKKDVETVEYDLEPDVEPIRAEVKPEPEKKKRTRKSKTESNVEAVAEVISEVNSSNTLENMNIEPIVESIPVIDEPSIIVETPVEETPNILGENAFNFDFGGFNESTTVSVPEKVEENKGKIKGSSGRKPLTPSEISAAISMGETIKQTPIIQPDSDDEVDLSSLGGSFASNAPADNMGFGSFADLGSFDLGGNKPEEKKENESELPFSFGGFGGFNDFENVKPSNNEPSQDDIEDVIPSGGFSFGDLGNFNMANEVKEEKKPVETVTPDGWGTGFDFGDLGDFGSILNSSDIKFGE